MNWHRRSPAELAAADRGIAAHRDVITQLVDAVRTYRAAGDLAGSAIHIPDGVVTWLYTRPPLQLLGLMLVLLSDRASRPDPHPSRDSVGAAVAVLHGHYGGNPDDHRAAAQALAAAGLLTPEAL